MKHIQPFLAYYTIVVSTTLLIWAVFINHSSETLIIALLFVPCGLYFWLNITKIVSPAKEAVGNSFAKTILVALIISSASAFIYGSIFSNATQTKSLDSNILKALSDQISAIEINPTQTMDPQITQQLKSISSRLAKLESDSAPSTSLASISTDNHDTNIYKEKSTTSPILGKLTSEKNYLIVEKSPDWYLIFNENVEGTQGYVQAKLVKERNY